MHPSVLGGRLDRKGHEKVPRNNLGRRKNLVWELGQTVLHGKPILIKTLSGLVSTYWNFARERALIQDGKAIVVLMMMYNEIVLHRASWNCKCVVIVVNSDVLILAKISNKLSRRGFRKRLQSCAPYNPLIPGPLNAAAKSNVRGPSKLKITCVLKTNK